MKFFPSDAVRVTGGPFAAAIRTDLAYVLALDPARLLAPFLREAGLAPDAAPYGNWEDSGLDGHTAGHWLSALAHLHAATGDPEPLRRLTAALDVLERAQDAVGTGWLGGVPRGAALFESLAGGGAAAARALGSSTHWVPWYNLHKTFQGLVDAHVVAGDERALRMAGRLADWWLAISRRMDDDAFEAMLDTEFGGMNEAFADLAELTGRADFAAEARRFAHRAILDPLLEGRDDLTGRHANTQIPKAVGYAALAEQRPAAEAFWRTVVAHRTVAIGGNSVREHFHDPADFAPMVEDREGPETCNTYNMLKLTRRLAEAALRPELLDYAERALFNHVLSAQRPGGGFAYFTSMRPRHYRVYSQPQEGFWCCVGTGMEMQARYGEWIFGVEDGALAVNLFAHAELDAPAFGVRLRMAAAIPADEHVAIAVSADEPRTFALRLRVPAWAGSLDDVRVNGGPVEATAVDGAVLVERTWAEGDELTFCVPLSVHAERLPDGSPWQAHLAGPVVLAARDDSGDLAGLLADGSRMGHIAAGPLRPFADLPLVADGAGGVVPDGPLRWRLATSSGDVVLEPFAAIHDSRYTIYWPVDEPGRREALAAQDAHLALDAATVDAVAFGEQQPESDHAFAGDDSVVWTDGAVHGRTVGSGLTVVLNDPAWHSRKLRIGVRSDVGAALAIRLGDALVAEADVTAGDEVLEFVIAPPATGARLSLAPVDGRPSPVVTEARLLR